MLPEYKDAEDRDFARKLFRSTILNGEQYQRYMSDASRNWDFSRLAYMDVVIMQIAIAELVNFPNIPATVTINEYVDLAKAYSTHRSGGYVNGMLDNIGRFLIDKGIIQGIACSQGAQKIIFSGATEINRIIYTFLYI